MYDTWSTLKVLWHEARRRRGVYPEVGELGGGERGRGLLMLVFWLLLLLSSGGKAVATRTPVLPGYGTP
jgi:hypothetical protein